MPPDRSDQRLSFGAGERMSLAPLFAQREKKCLKEGRKEGQERDIYPSCGSTQPDGKGIHRKQKPKEEGFLRLDEGGGVFIAEGGECRGEVSFRFPCPMPCRQSHTPKKRRSMGENRSARCAGKTAASRRPAKRNSSIMRKASIVSRRRADGRKRMLRRP